MKMRHVCAALVLLAGLTACDEKKKEAPKDKEEAPSAETKGDGPTEPTKTEEKESDLDPKVEKALAALKEQALPLTKDNHDRGELCGHLRTVAEKVDTCAPCLEAYVKVIDGEDDRRVVDCSGERLAQVKENAGKLCTSLIEAWKRNKYGNSQALAGLTFQGASCKDQMDAFVGVLEEKFAAYDNSYGSLGPANLIYVNRMLEHMTPEQKKKVAEAAKKLEKLAREKKDRKGKVSTATADEAKKLATDASG